MKRFKAILCVVEPEKAYKPALERAVALAEHNQSSLTVLDVIERVPSGVGMPADGPMTADLQVAMLNARQKQLDALVESYRKRIDIQTKVLKGVPFLEIIREVLRGGHDLLVKIPETHDWLDRLFGSDDMHLLRKCPCPVWLIKLEAPKAYRRILVAVDVDDGYAPEELETRRALNHQIMELAGSLALTERAELHVVHAWDAVAEHMMRSALVNTPEEKITAYTAQVRRHHKQALDTLLREASGNLGEGTRNALNLQTHLVKGWARKEIPALAKRIEPDLIVMGTVARTGVPGFIMGNTAETILNQIDCSVLAIKPPGFTTPITLED